jgi:hypothetical protein
VEQPSDLLPLRLRLQAASDHGRGCAGATTIPTGAGSTVDVIHAGARPLGVAHAALPSGAKSTAGARNPEAESF